jgi:ABC-type multidrug transport system ATPase subunit
VPVHAVVHVTLSVPAGQVVGILGPNAAGKTTLLKLIAGMVRPTAGHVHVRGYDMARETALALRQLGVALEARAWTVQTRRHARQQSNTDQQISFRNR